MTTIESIQYKYTIEIGRCLLFEYYSKLSKIENKQCSFFCVNILNKLLYLKIYRIWKYGLWVWRKFQRLEFE